MATGIVGRTASRRSSTWRSGRSRPAAPPSSAGIGRRVTGAAPSRITYNSCRNRHCPKCQTLTKERWLAARRADLLPIPYFHVVFTLPHDLNALAQGNPRVIYTLLFRAAADTLLTFGRDARAPRRHDWDHRDPPHVGPESLATSPSPLPRHRRRLGPGWLAVDRRSLVVPVSGPSAVDGISCEISRRPPARLRRRPADLRGRHRRSGRRAKPSPASSVSCEPSTGSSMRSGPSLALSRCSTTSVGTRTASRSRMIGSSIITTAASGFAGRTTPTTTV